MKCKLCNKEAAHKDYCELHGKACRNLMEKYGAWKKALGLSWVDFLNQVAQNPSTGTKAREVAEALLSESL